MKQNLLKIGILIIFLVSCQSKNTSEENPEKVTSPGLPAPVKSIIYHPKVNYVFVAILAEYPKLDEYNIVRWQDKRFFSNIIEVENINEDKEYKLMDSVQKSLSINNSDFISEVSKKVFESEKRAKLFKVYPKVAERMVIKFNTYHEASEKLERARYDSTNN